MKKHLSIITIAFILLGIVNIQSQNLNPTSSISLAGSADTFKAGYTFSYSTSGTPWNGSLISYGGFSTNNYDTQISSDYGPNGGSHISYRTRNGDANTWNTWNELATRGTNNFIGNQSITKNLGIGIVNPQASLDIYKSYDVNITKAIKVMYQGSWGTPQYATNYRFIEINSTEGGNILAVNAYGMGIGTNPPSYNSPDKLYINGNVGIGTTNPSNKLDVNGTIHSKEVKVDMNGWPDYVFKNKYNLPTLEEVEKHIKENGHLKDIPNEAEVIKNGIYLGEMDSKLLQKIEEITLYMIELKKENIEMKKKNEELTLYNIDQQNTIDKLERENESFKNLEERLSRLEKESESKK